MSSNNITVKVEKPAIFNIDRRDILTIQIWS
jgi:hypothetical protein